jgi:hypothetical protein
MSDATSSLRQTKLPLILALLYTKSLCYKQTFFCAVRAGKETCAQRSPVNVGQSSASSTVPFASSSFLSLQSTRRLFVPFDRCNNTGEDHSYDTFWQGVRRGTKQQSKKADPS